MTTADAKVELVEQLWADLRSRCPSISALTEDSREVALTKAHLRAAITALEASHNSRTEATDETGWLIEENAGGFIHWVALAKDAWPRTKVNRFSRRFGFEDYLTPVERVKDANEALRFARKQDAEAFIELFRIFLLCPIATEHSWPAMQAARPIDQQEARKCRECLKNDTTAADGICPSCWEAIMSHSPVQDDDAEKVR